MQHFDQIVVGGGVIGAAIAYQLSKRGYHVLLLEEKKIGEGASSAAAGMLGVQVEFTKRSTLFQFANESRMLFPKLATELKATSGIDIQFKQKGAYKLIDNEKEREKLHEMAQFQVNEGIEASVISPEEVTTKEQNISPSFIAALHCPKEGQVSAVHLTEAFALASKRLGATLQEYAKVEDLIIENNKVQGVKTKHNYYYAEQVVITAGYKSKTFANYLPNAAPITPVKGECLSVRSTQSIMESTIFTKDCYIVPKKSNRIIIGAVSSSNQTDKEINMNSMQHLINRSTTIIPALKETSIEKMWAGIRPFIEDDNPFIGRISGLDGLYMATGHYRNGILLSPKTATFIADLMEGKNVSREFVEAFSPNRHHVKEVIS